MDGSGDYYAKWNKPVRKKTRNHMISLTLESNEQNKQTKKEKKRNVTEGGLILTSSDPLGKLHGKPSYRRQFAW